VAEERRAPPACDRFELHDPRLGSPDRTSWASATRNLLNRSGGCNRNVVVWSWCGRAHTGNPADISTYLNLMSQLENEFPGVKLVYMTGHLAGWNG